jgi:hypothetical protein
MEKVPYVLKYFEEVGAQRPARFFGRRGMLDSSLTVERL